MKKQKKTVSLLLALVMAFSLIGVSPASARAEAPIDYVARWWDADKQQVMEETRTCTEYTSMATFAYGGDHTLTSGWYVAVDRSFGHLTISGEVNLILPDDAYMVCINGISVEENNTLNIYAQEGSSDLGVLGVTNQDDSTRAVIGGSGWRFGNINIHGGVVNATVNADKEAGAGIGGGTIQHESSLGSRSVHIYGGSVTAAGGYHGAGIGGGNGNGPGNIRIYGGNVTATGGEDASGIGSGYFFDYGESTESVEIYGGTVYAYGGDKSAGIGGGRYSSGGRVTINDGVIYAYGGAKGAGIGGGSGYNNKGSYYSDGRSGNITINGGEVYAYGGDEAAGIGSGNESNNNDGEIVINGGKVHAYGGKDYGAGIGGGDLVEGGVIRVTGGEVFAVGGYRAAGIGGGDWRRGGTITISGGEVHAQGGDEAAGIGGGNNNSGGDINITGGTVYASGGPDYGAGIGGGDEGSGGIIKINGGEVHVHGGNEAAGIGGGRDAGGSAIYLGNSTIYATGGKDCAAIGGGGHQYYNSVIEIWPGLKLFVEGAGNDGFQYNTWNLFLYDTENAGSRAGYVSDGQKVFYACDARSSGLLWAKVNTFIEPCPHDGAVCHKVNEETHHVNCPYCASKYAPHDFEVTWTWSEDCTSAVAHIQCADCGYTSDVAAATERNADGSYVVFRATAEHVGVTYSDEKKIQGSEVTLLDAENGKVEANYRSALPGEKVSLTLQPDAYCYLSEISVVSDPGGEAVNLSGEGDVRTFTMPDHPVVVSAKFMRYPADVTRQVILAPAEGSGMVVYTYDSNRGWRTVQSGESYPLGTSFFVLTVVLEGYKRIGPIDQMVVMGWGEGAFVIASETEKIGESPISNPDDPDAAIEDFVTRLYQGFLGREPDEGGLKEWVKLLAAGESTGCAVVKGFAHSAEFANRIFDDVRYIMALYLTIFGRMPDEEGVIAWLAVLDNGCTRDKVLEGFLKSPEMANLCEAAGIEQGTYKSGNIADQNYQVTSFVSRLYRLILGRKADAVGLESWLDVLLSGEKTASDVVGKFFKSEEWQNRGTSDEEFLTAAYNAILDREPDEDGYAAWLAYLTDGADRARVLEKFLKSKEFGILCDAYGVQR